MRLIFLMLIIAPALIIAFFRPYIGLLVFSWLAYMRPHDLAWGAEGLRLSLYIMIPTFLGCMFHRNEKLLLKSKKSYLLISLLMMWIISAACALDTSLSMPKGVELVKIIVIALLTTGLVTTKRRFKWLSWTIALSLGLLALKSSLYVIMKGGYVRGPGGMIADNNDFSLALVMILPFLFYLGKNEQGKTLKALFYVLMSFTIIAIIYTYSRGGFIGLCVVMMILALRAKKLIGITGLIVGIWLFLTFAPETYIERIKTIKSYQQDESAMGRINAWHVVENVVKERPLTGIGPGNFVVVYSKFDKQGGDPRVAHNAYLQILADSGIIAFSIFIIILVSCIVSLRRLRNKELRAETKRYWVINYAYMLEVSLYGFMSCGMFLSRADFDLLYHVIALTICLEAIAGKNLQKLRKRVS